MVWSIHNDTKAVNKSVFRMRMLARISLRTNVVSVTEKLKIIQFRVLNPTVFSRDVSKFEELLSSKLHVNVAEASCSTVRNHREK